MIQRIKQIWRVLSIVADNTLLHIVLSLISNNLLIIIITIIVITIIISRVTNYSLISARNFSTNS